MTGTPGPFDIWADFNGISTDGTVVTYAEGDLAVGMTLTAGDNEGNRCSATVAALDGDRITLRLDMDRFEATP